MWDLESEEEDGIVKRSRSFAYLLTIATFSLISSTLLPAQGYKILHSFGGPGDGADSSGGIVMDGSGNLYGTTAAGGVANSGLCGTHGCGIVYKLSPNQNGTWTESILHSFDGYDGSGGCGLAPVLDAQGNLYSCATYVLGGGGTIYKLTPQANGQWTFSLLFELQDGPDGSDPAGVTLYRGNLYATSAFGGGGGNGGGVAFELSQTAPGQWSETTLYGFNGYYGSLPNGLTFDAIGNAYGTTFQDGQYGDGNVFRLTPGHPSNGQWSETILYAFQGSDGAGPSSTVVFDRAGNLYSTTAAGGPGGAGVVFELSPNPDGNWTEQILYAFSDYATPYAGVTFDFQGNLYGAAEGNGYGYIYKLTPSSNGQWTFTNLHQFDGQDGAFPFANVILDSSGNVYGTTELGGTYNKGVVFEITP